MSKYDVIHKTGTTKHISTPPEEDRATVAKVTGTKDSVKIGGVIPKTRSRTDKHTYRHAHHNTPLPCHKLRKINRWLSAFLRHAFQVFASLPVRKINAIISWGGEDGVWAF